VAAQNRERRAFTAAFKAWDRNMTRMVMSKPLHEDWVPQIFAADHFSEADGARGGSMWAGSRA
jgi:hypothetical protein